MKTEETADSAASRSAETKKWIKDVEILYKTLIKKYLDSYVQINNAIYKITTTYIDDRHWGGPYQIDTIQLNMLNYKFEFLPHKHGVGTKDQVIYISKNTKRNEFDAIKLQMHGATWMISVSREDKHWKTLTKESFDEAFDFLINC